MEKQAGQAGLQHRLLNGVIWLTDRHAKLMNMERIGIGSKAEEEFLDALMMWNALEFTLRFVYPEYQGCSLGEGRHCQNATPVSCRSCGGLGDKDVADAHH